MSQQIKNQHDLKQYEQNFPLNLPSSTYRMLCESEAQFGDKKALTFVLNATQYQNSTSYSYRDLLAYIRQTANMLYSLGAHKDTVIAILLPNLPETHFCIWGGEATGIIFPINPLLEPSVIAGLLNEVKATLLITLAPLPNQDNKPQLWDKAIAVAKLTPSLQHIIGVTMAHHFAHQLNITLPEASKEFVQQLPETITYHDFYTGIANQPKDRLINPRTIGPEHLSSFFGTGGTTGMPKIAMRNHKNEVANVLQARALFGNDMLNQGNVVLCGLPLFHVNAVMVTGLLPLSMGGEILLVSPEGYRGDGVMANFWAIIAHYRVNFFSGVPTLFAGLLNLPVGDHDIASLKHCLCGAAPMPMEVFKQFEKQTGVQIIEAYGMTEGNCGSSANPRFGEKKIGSIGLRFPYQPMQVMMLDDNGKFVRVANTGEVGNICIRGDNVFVGYYLAQQNQGIWVTDTDNHTWFNSGDLGYQDVDGYFFLTGRKKELIIRGGHNIDPKMIEEVVYQYDGVAGCAAIGKPDSYTGELPVLFVAPKPGVSLDTDKLMQFCQQNIGEKAAIPKAIYVIEALPLTAVGKVFKPALKRQATVMTVSELLLQHHIKATVSSKDDPTYGFIVLVNLECDALHQLQAKTVLDQLAIHWQWDE
nr:acyl-CoA synthetase [uncultured Moraxella sp.]